VGGSLLVQSYDVYALNLGLQLAYDFAGAAGWSLSHHSPVVQGRQGYVSGMIEGGTKVSGLIP
jgi:hypothetical protein